MGAFSRATHKDGAASALSGRSFLVGCIGLMLSIGALVMIFGESARPVFEAPDVPLEAAGQPPTVQQDPAATEPRPSTTSPEKKPAGKAAAPTVKAAKPAPTTDKPVSMRAWSAVGTYEKGELVTYRGGTYRALQDYTGVGDPDWINAESLWVRV